MAFNPLIALQGKPMNIGAAFNNALTTLQGFEKLKQMKEQRELDAQLQPLRERLLEAKVLDAEQQYGTAHDALRRRELARLNSVADAAEIVVPMIKAGKFDRAKLFLENRRNFLLSQSTPENPVDTTNTDIALELIEENPELLIQQGEEWINTRNRILARESGPVKLQKGSTILVDTPEGPAFATAAFDPTGGPLSVQTAPLGEGTRLLSTLGETAEQQTERRIYEAAGTEAAKAGVRLETDPQITAATEEAKFKKQRRFKPQIERAVIAAKKDAEAKGEAFTELEQMQAALPGLNQAVNSLRELAPIATSTFAGKIWDAAVKETGFGATKGSTAKAKFTAIVRNQVLPLLKPTFGAAFTVQEGEKLEATLGDPDASPEEKLAQLDAFIEQKVRDIETKKRFIGEPAGDDPLSDEERALLERLRGNQ